MIHLQAAVVSTFFVLHVVDDVLAMLDAPMLIGHFRCRRELFAVKLAVDDHHGLCLVLAGAVQCQTGDILAQIYFRD